MDNYIFCRKKALDSKTSENLVEFVERSHKLKNLRGYHYINGNLRSPTFNFIRGVLISGIQEYREDHPFLKKSVGDATLHLDPDFMIKKFFPGDYYDCTRFSDPKEAEHTEHGVDEDDSRRVLAWMFYLNDIKIEGGTCWPQQGFTVNLKQEIYISGLLDGLIVIMEFLLQKKTNILLVGGVL